MEQRVFKRGLLFRLANTYGNLYDTETDICTFTKHVGLGLFSIALIAVILGLFGAVFLDMLLWIGVMIVYGVVIAPSEIAMIGALLTGAGILFAIAWYFIKGVRAASEIRTIAAIKESISERLCFPVKFE